MNKITILGVVHGNTTAQAETNYANILSGPESDEFLVRDYFPNFEEKKTLLILEGKFHPHLLTPEHGMYEELVKITSRALYDSDYGPDLVAGDTRWKDRNKAIVIHHKFFELDEWMKDNIASKNIPETFDEVQRSFINGTVKYGVSFIKSPPIDVKKVARQVFNAHQEMEDYMIRKATHYTNEYDQIFIVVGAGHAIPMHRKSKIPYKILFEPKDEGTVAAMYANMLLVKECPEILMNF